MKQTMFSKLAYLVAKIGSHSPYGSLRIPATVARIVPQLREYPVRTRYGEIICDLRYVACLPLLQRGEYFWWRGDEAGFSSLPISAGTRVADIGANIGVMTRMFAGRGAKVHAFEPSPSVRRLLDRNAEGLDVQIHPVALADCEGTIEFTEIEGSSVQHIGPGIEVEMRTLDSYGLDFDVIKIDVEGYEHLVLKGATQTILRCKPVILFEALSEAARQYCEDIIRSIVPDYEFETLPEGVNHVARIRKLSPT